MEFAMHTIINQLRDIGAIQYGEFTLKSGMKSPIYVDLRMAVSVPQLCQRMAEAMWQKAAHVSFDLLCGVPYTALPFASYVSMRYQKPMVIRRKEAKDYGTKKIVEGIFKPGQRCLIFEDVITSGESILETIASLEEAGLRVTDIVAFLDRQQGGTERLRQKGYNVHCVVTLPQLLEKPSHPLTNRLFDIINAKKTNVAVAADVTTCKQLLDLAHRLGPHICMFKTHVDMLDDFSLEVAWKLRDLSERHNFLIFEDRKFADIGNTVLNQYRGGLYRISEWAHITNAHTLAGPGTIEALAQVGVPKGNGLLLLAQMSSEGNLLDETYTQKTVELAQNYPEFVMGLVAQKRLAPEFGTCNAWGANGTIERCFGSTLCKSRTSYGTWRRCNYCRARHYCRPRPGATMPGISTS